MLADVEDVGVVQGEVCALGLCDVEIVALGVGGGMQGEEGVGWVGAGVGDRESESKGVWVVFVRVLK